MGMAPEDDANEDDNEDGDDALLMAEALSVPKRGTLGRWLLPR